MKEFILDNWQWFLLAFFILEKVVKITPSKADDILLDVVWYGIKKIAGKGKGK